MCAGLESSGAMGDDERDVVTSWMALVALAAQEVGCGCGCRTAGGRAAASTSSGTAGYPASEQPFDDGPGSMDASSLGMRRFVKQARPAQQRELADLMAAALWFVIINMRSEAARVHCYIIGAPS